MASRKPRCSHGKPTPLGNPRRVRVWVVTAKLPGACGEVTGRVSVDADGPMRHSRDPDADAPLIEGRSQG